MNSIANKHENSKTHPNRVRYDASRATELPRAVAEIGKIHFEGNIIPHEWYNHLKLPSGKPDGVGIILLSEIVYWYRPVTRIDEPTGRKIIKCAKFSGDKLRSPIGYYQEKFGFTKDQVRQALKRLEKGGVITREYRDYEFSGMKMTNVTYVEPVAERIWEITHPEPESSELEPDPEDGPENGSERVAEPVSKGAVSVPQGEVSIPQGAVSVPLCTDFSKISTKTTTTTTPLPPSSIKSDDPSTDESRSRGDLIYPKELLPEERKEATRMLEAVSEQAQPLLDELAGQLRAKEIKNPLGYLRGLITKSKEEKFSATIGIKVRESRKQRARIEASIRASEEKQRQGTRGGYQDVPIFGERGINWELNRQRLAELRKSIVVQTNGRVNQSGSAR